MINWTDWRVRNLAPCLGCVKSVGLNRSWADYIFDITAEDFHAMERTPNPMRYFVLIVLLISVGCENLRGPLAPRQPVRVDDPRLSIAEQQELGRDRIGLPDNTPVLPPESGARPGR